MYIMMGIGNMLLESILDAIIKVDGLEDTPDSLHQKWWAHLIKKKEYSMCKDMFLIWSEYGGACLGNLHISHSMLIHFIALDGKYWDKIQKDFATADKMKLLVKYWSW